MVPDEEQAVSRAGGASDQRLRGRGEGGHRGGATEAPRRRCRLDGGDHGGDPAGDPADVSASAAAAAAAAAACGRSRAGTYQSTWVTERCGQLLF